MLCTFVNFGSLWDQKYKVILSYIVRRGARLGYIVRKEDSLGYKRTYERE